MEYRNCVIVVYNNDNNDNNDVIVIEARTRTCGFKFDFFLGEQQRVAGAMVQQIGSN